MCETCDEIEGNNMKGINVKMELKTLSYCHRLFLDARSATLTFGFIGLFLKLSTWWSRGFGDRRPKARLSNLLARADRSLSSSW